MNYTKGKWSVSTSGNKQFNKCVIAEDGGSICHITNWSEAEANANVIAKVPEMIEALKNVYRLRNIILPPAADIKVEHQDEVTAIYQAIKKIESLLKELES